MTEDDIRAGFLEDLVRIAPDVDPGTIGGGDDLQDDLGLDSMDVLALVSALHKRFGVDVPEADYAKIATPDAAVAYVMASISKSGA